MAGGFDDKEEGGKVGRVSVDGNVNPHTHTVSLNGTGGRIDTAGPNEKASQPAAPASTLRI